MQRGRGCVARRTVSVSTARQIVVSSAHGSSWSQCQKKMRMQIRMKTRRRTTFGSHCVPRWKRSHIHEIWQDTSVICLQSDMGTPLRSGMPLMSNSRSFSLATADVAVLSMATERTDRTCAPPGSAGCEKGKLTHSNIFGSWFNGNVVLVARLLATSRVRKPFAPNLALPDRVPIQQVQAIR